MSFFNRPPPLALMLFAGLFLGFLVGETIKSCGPKPVVSTVQAPQNRHSVVAMDDIIITGSVDAGKPDRIGTLRDILKEINKQFREETKSDHDIKFTMFVSISRPTLPVVVLNQIPGKDGGIEFEFVTIFVQEEDLWILLPEVLVTPKM